MSTTIEQLELEVQSNASSAVSGIDALATSLGRLKDAVKGGAGLTSTSKQLATLNTTLNNISQANIGKMASLGQAFNALSSASNLKLSSSVATQITNIGVAVRSLNGTDFSSLTSLADALTSLTQIGRSNLGSFIKSLSKLPQLITELKSAGISELAPQIQQLANALSSLATPMQTVSSGFASLSTKIQKLTSSTNQVDSSNNKASKSYTTLAAKVGVTLVAMKKIASTLAVFINKSNQYIEDLNLFNASMGEYATSAQEYAEQVGEIMGIDPGEWMRNQGVFMTLATGFGVASDRAYTMSQNLTQLGYDISSFFNISFEDSMAKLQSGLSGELEPLRRIGYDLSVARLQQEAYNLGIEKSVSAMTQAEKAELRYYAIMTQVTTVQGDMARTLTAPANQLRILKAQVEQCARSIGNIFIPVLNAVLPYLVAVAKVARMLADIIASLFGFSLPEVDYSGVSSSVGSVADSAEDVSNGLSDATKNAKKLKNALLGIDELNVLSRDDDSSSGSGSGSGVDVSGGGLGIDLPTYDFLAGAIGNRIDDIVQKMKEWLGLNEKINSLSDLLHTRLGRILTTVGAIALGLAAWKISKGVLSALKYMQDIKALGLDDALTITVGISLLVTGVALEWAGIIDAIQYELNKMNFAQIITGGLLTIGGSSILGKGIASWIINSFADSSIATALATAASNLGLGSASAAGAAIGAGIGGIIAGIPAYIVGIYDAINNGLNWLNGLLIPAGSTAATAGIGAIIGACGGPIGAGIGALIGLAVGLVTDGIILIVQNWDTITEFLNNFFTVTVPGLWNNFISWVKNIPNELEKFFESIPGKISAWFDNLWKPIKEYDWNNLGYNIGQWFGNAWNTAVEFVTVRIPIWFLNMQSSVKTAVSKFLTQTLPAFITQILPSLWETIETNAVTFFTVTLPNALRNIDEWFFDIGVAIGDGIREGWDTITQAIGDFVDGFVQGFKDALGIHSPSTVFAEIGNDIVDGLLQGIEGFTDMLSTMTEWANSVVEWFTQGEDGIGIVERFKEVGSDIINGFKDKISSTYSAAKTNVITWGTNVKEWFTNSSFGGVNSENFSTFANNIIEGFKTKVSTTYTSAKSSIITWASNVKSWFSSSSFGGVNGNTFLSYATNIVNGFKDRINNYYTAAQSAMNTFGSKVKSWFTDHVSYSKFYNIASDVVEGFKNGIGNLYQTCRNNISSWGSSIISWFKETLDSNSPSKVFMHIGEDTVRGYNIGIANLSKTTNGVVTDWTNSFSSMNPTMSFAVDTSALKYYNSDSFANAVSADVSGKTTITATGFKEGMEEFYKEYVEPIMSRMADDVRRQADKNEQTIVKVGNRTVTDAVSIQQKANGYVFAR